MNRHFFVYDEIRWDGPEKEWASETGWNCYGNNFSCNQYFFLRVSSVYISPLSWQFLVRSMKTNAAGWRRNREKGNPESFSVPNISPLRSSTLQSTGKPFIEWIILPIVIRRININHIWQAADMSLRGTFPSQNLFLTLSSRIPRSILLEIKKVSQLQTVARRFPTR